MLDRRERCWRSRRPSALQAGRDAAYPRGSAPSERLLYTRSGTAVKRLALEFDALAADVYWIRAIQHYGGDRLARRSDAGSYELLQPLLDLTTTLDPFFTIAYRFGAIFLSEAPPGGPGRPDQAIALLEKGIAAQPEKWQYFHDIAFVHYWHLHDPADRGALVSARRRPAGRARTGCGRSPRRCSSARDRSAARMSLAADPAVRPAVAAAHRASAACRSCRRSIRSTSCRRSCRQRRSAGRPARHRGPISCAAACCRGIPVDPDRRALRARSRHRQVAHLADVAAEPDAGSAPAAAMSTDTLVLVCLVLLGLAVGSFLNVCIHRVPSRASVVSPGSRCPSCGYALRLGRQHPGGQLRHARRTLPLVPRADLASAIRSSS